MALFQGHSKGKCFPADEETTERLFCLMVFHWNFIIRGFDLFNNNHNLKKSEQT